MPFTFEQLIEQLELGQISTASLNTYLDSRPNLKIVFNYLGGNSNALHGLTADYENYAFQKLVSLLNDINPPSQNDQLVLDVVTHPDVCPYIRQFVAQWLVSYSVQKNSSSAITAASALFKNLGYNNDEIFFLSTYFLQYNEDNYKNVLAENSEIKKYLLSIIPKQILPGPPHGVYWNYGWNNLYFLLLEEGQPNLLEDYMINELCQNSANINYLVDYKEGKYLPVVLNWLNHSNSFQAEFEAKFETAVLLYEKDDKQFEKIAINLAKRYVAYYEQTKPDEQWRNNTWLQLSKTTGKVRITYSAVAIHFLYIDDPSTAKDLVFRWFNNKMRVSFDVLLVLFHHIQQEVLPYLKFGLKAEASLGGIEYYRRIIDLLINEFQPADYVELLWQLISSKSKPLREEISKLLAEKDPDAEPKAIQLLQSKNAEARQTAALILSFFNSANALNAIKAILNTEANDNARDIFLQIAAASLPVKSDKQFIKEMVQAAANRNKLNKPIEPWLNESDLPPLFFQDGDQLNQQEVRFLFYRMSRAKAMRSDIEAKYLIELLDKERSGLFAKHIIQLFIDKESKPEYKYLMAVAAMLGGDETVDKLRTVVNGWIEIYRTKMVEYGIGALALQGSNKALRIVEYYSRKYKNKTASVGASASQALEDAAEDLGISTHELGDRIVPDFGFDGLFKHFTINSVEYRAFIDSNFKLAYFDEENKKLKALPSTAGKELKEEFKDILKEVRDVVKSQSLRLEHYLVTQRRWNSEEWQNFYLTNPVMFIYATKLLWGKYDREGNLLECFLCLDDTSLINLEDDEIELKDDVFVGIVHPIQLDAESLQKWKKKLFDLSVETIFPQLERKIAAVKDEDKNKKISFQFNGVETAEGAIKGTLEKHGWRKGQTGDGGYLDHFIFENRTSGINAVLEVEGVFVGGYGSDSDPKLGRLFFIDKKKKTTKWFMFPKDDKDESLISLDMLDRIFYSEVVGSISLIKPKNENNSL